MEPGKSTRRIVLSSDKCDFRVEAEALDLRGQIAPEGLRISAGLPHAGVRIDSAKCDWRVGSLPADPFGGIGVAGRPTFDQLRSAKRDWLTASDVVSRPAARVISAERTVDIVAVGERFRADVGSDKCDWRFAGRDEIRDADFRVSGERMDLRVSGRGFGGAMSSDKCDWMIFTRGEEVMRPGLEARLTSQPAGEYSLRVELGIPGGARIRVTGVGSGKAGDFRIDQVAQSKDGKEWHDLPLRKS